MQQSGLYMSDSSQVANARRIALGIATAIGLPEKDIARLALVVTELGTNLIKHAQQGELWFTDNPAHNPCVQIISLDRGPGMARVKQAMQDGFSTAGSPGNGLGAIDRQSDSFDLMSTQKGTVIVVEVHSAGTSNEKRSIGGISVPYRGEEVCGDGWLGQREDRFIRFIASDGLGHGAGANEASSVALQIFKTYSANGPRDVVQRTHLASRHTRGMALAVGEIDCVSNSVRFSSIGNIAAVITTDKEVKHLVSQNGTVGHTMPRNIDELSYDWTSKSILIAHSDGLSSKWKLQDYGGIPARHPRLNSCSSLS